MISAADAAVQWVADHAARPRRSLEQRRARTMIMVGLVAAWFLVPPLVQHLSAVNVWLPTGSQRSYAPAAAMADNVLLLAVLVFAGLMIIEALVDPPSTGGPVLLVALLPWLWLVGVDLAVGVPFAPSELMYPLIMIACATLRPDGDELVVLGGAVLATAAASMLLGILGPTGGLSVDAAGRLLSTDKELLPWGVLVGVFSHGNNLGQFLLLGLPFLLCLRRRPVIIVAVVVVGIALVWSAARTAVVGTAGVVAIGGALTVAGRRLPRRWAVMGAGVALGVTSLTVAILPITVSDPDFVSGRGWLWQRSLEAWRDRALTGWGSDWYARKALTTERLTPSAFNGHNLLVHLLVTGGVVMVVLVGVLFAVAALVAFKRTGRSRVVWVCWLLAVAVESLTEVPVGLVNNLATVPVFALPLALLLFGDRETQES